MEIRKEQMQGVWRIALAATLWGTLGSFATLLIRAGVSPPTVAFLRLAVGFASMALYALIVDPKLFRIDGKGLMITLGIGLISQAGFNIVYFNAIKSIGIASSSVMLNTAPFFLTLWSVLVFQERVSTRKLLLLFLCFMGCLLAITGGNLTVLQLSAVGLLFGLLSAISYSLMSVMSRLALTQYNSTTIIIYSFIFGALFLLPFTSIADIAVVLSGPMTVLAALGLGVIPSAMAYLLYFSGLSKKVDLSKVGVISSLEMVVSIVFAIGFFGELMNGVKASGILMILISIVLINGQGRLYPLSRKKPLEEISAADEMGL